MKHILITLFLFVCALCHSEATYKAKLVAEGTLDRYERISWVEASSPVKTIVINFNSIIIEDEEFEVLDYPTSYKVSQKSKSCLYQCMTKDLEPVFIKIILYDDRSKACIIRNGKKFFKYFIR